MSLVYFVQPSGGGPIKIGTTTKLKTRFSTITPWVPGGIDIIATIPGFRVREAALQAILSPWRLKDEWFRPCIEVWSVAIEAAEHGDLAWLPPEESITRDEIIAHFGSVKGAIVALGANTSDLMASHLYPPPAAIGKFFAYQALKSGALPRLLQREQLRERAA